MATERPTDQELGVLVESLNIDLCRRATRIINKYLHPELARNKDGGFSFDNFTGGLVIYFLTQELVLSEGRHYEWYSNSGKPFRELASTYTGALAGSFARYYFRQDPQGAQAAARQCAQAVYTWSQIREDGGDLLAERGLLENIRNHLRTLRALENQP